MAQASTMTSTLSGRLRTSGKLGPITDWASAAAASNPAAMTNRRSLLPRVGQDVQPFELVHRHRRLDDGRLERIGVLALDARNFANDIAFGVHLAEPRSKHDVALTDCVG